MSETVLIPCLVMDGYGKGGGGAEGSKSVNLLGDNFLSQIDAPTGI